MGQENLVRIVRSEISRGWIGGNRSCNYYPCHYDGQDCTFCYCPFYPCNDTRFGKELGRPKMNDTVWACDTCLMIHDTDVCKHIVNEMRRLGITEPDDPRIKDIFPSAAKIYLDKDE
jgi:Zn-finger protein